MFFLGLSTSLTLSLSFSVSLCVCVSMSVSVCVSLSLFDFFLCFCPSLCVSLCLSFSVCLSLPLLLLSFVLPCVSPSLPFHPLVLSHTFVLSPSLFDFLSFSLSLAFTHARRHARTHARTPPPPTHTNSSDIQYHMYWYPFEKRRRKKKCNACTICHYLVSDKTCRHRCTFCHLSDKTCRSDKTPQQQLYEDGARGEIARLTCKWKCQIQHQLRWLSTGT